MINFQLLKNLKVRHEKFVEAAAQGDLDLLKRLLLLKQEGEIDVNWVIHREFRGTTRCLTVKHATALLRAVACNQRLSVIRFLLQHGADVNARDDDGWSALIFASYLGNVPTMRLLMDDGANLEAKTTSGCCPGHTPLLMAVSFGGDDAMLLLLIRGANLEAKDNIGNTALIRAASSGETPMVRALLDKGADINARNYLNETALAVASRNEHIETVRTILRRGKADRSGCHHFLCKIY